MLQLDGSVTVSTVPDHEGLDQSDDDYYTRGGRTPMSNRFPRRSRATDGHGRHAAVQQGRPAVAVVAANLNT